jgi:hypothetical protein
MPECYIRRKGQPWTRGNIHHLAALTAYRNREGEPGEEVRISVPHQRGGDFVAHFFPINHEMCYYRDEYGNEVEIAMIEPERAAYINRIMDG